MIQKAKIIILAVLFALSLCLTLYPLVSNWMGEKNRSIVQSEYHEAVTPLERQTTKHPRESPSLPQAKPTMTCSTSAVTASWDMWRYPE